MWGSSSREPGRPRIGWWRCCAWPCRTRAGDVASGVCGRRCGATPVATDGAVFGADVLIEDGRIAGIAERGAVEGADELIDATGLVVMPGAIDTHAHFEDPGHTEREDFTTGTMSAAAGGITTVLEHP